MAPHPAPPAISPAYLRARIRSRNEKGATSCSKPSKSARQLEVAAAPAATAPYRLPRQPRFGRPPAEQAQEAVLAAQLPPLGARRLDPRLDARRRRSRASSAARTPPRRPPRRRRGRARRPAPPPRARRSAAAAPASAPTMPTLRPASGVTTWPWPLRRGRRRAGLRRRLLPGAASAGALLLLGAGGLACRGSASARPSGSRRCRAAGRPR